MSSVTSPVPPSTGPVVVQEEVLTALAGGAASSLSRARSSPTGCRTPTTSRSPRQIEGAVGPGARCPRRSRCSTASSTSGSGATQVERVCTDPAIAKLSIRDVGVAAALGSSGATTVASTSALAHLAGIRVFATGGLGGVHRGAAETFDVSADLGVIASTPVLVVCAGVKSILDVAGTLKTLETLSVPVLGYRTDAFPGFYLSDSGHSVPWRVESSAEAAPCPRDP